MARTPVPTAALLALAFPVQALASSTTGAEGAWGDGGAIALVGVAAALAWHHVSRRRESIVLRWQQMHLGERLPHLRLGERFQGLQLRSALLAALGVRPDAPQAASHVRRVLVVDDDPEIRMAIGEALGLQGFAVSEAADGFEALRHAREEHPDVILLDLMMPRMDGFAFRAAQRADDGIASIPVVVVSGAEPAQVQGFGAAAYLHKPFDLSVLLDAVDRHAVAAAA